MPRVFNFPQLIPGSILPAEKVRCQHLSLLGMTPSVQEEAAQLDGAPHARIFLTITLPMFMGSVSAIGLLVFVQSWNEYLFAVVLATDHAMTLPPWAAEQLSMKEAQAGGEAEEWAHLLGGNSAYDAAASGVHGPRAARPGQAAVPT
jgi:hypothetical protein